MTGPLQPDDPVTIILLDTGVALTRIRMLTRDGFQTDETSISPWFRYIDEGCTWLRGWFMLDSPEVQAAQTANALLKKRDEDGVPQRISPTPKQVPMTIGRMAMPTEELLLNPQKWRTGK